MVYLFTLPGLAFNAPNASVPLIKGYLKENGITARQVDLSQRFLIKCVNSNYIKNYYEKYYDSLSFDEKKIVDNIDADILQLTNKKIDTDDIIEANYHLYQYLNILCRYYNILWKKRGIFIPDKLDSIDAVIEYSLRDNNDIFDILFETGIFSEKDIIYFSVMQPFQLIYALRFSGKIKSVYKNIKIIIGGDYITHIIENSCELLNKFESFDGIVFFGELKYLSDLINYFKDGKNYLIPNTYVRISDGSVFMNTIKKCTIFSKKNYIYDFEDLDLDGYLSNLKLVNMTLNYGCYHSKCKFCSRYFFYNGYARYNLTKMFNMIRELYLNYGIEAIYFVDECVPPIILKQLAEFLINNDIKIIWMVETRLANDLLNEDLVRLLYKSGLRQISFGIESLSKRILKLMGKGIEQKNIRKILKMFYLNNISVSATFMLNYPGESSFDRFKTLHFIKRFRYIDTFGLGNFCYMRHSILINDSKIDTSKDLNLVYRFEFDNSDKIAHKINRFNRCKKIRNFSKIREKIMYRSEYMYLDRKKYSLNYK